MQIRKISIGYDYKNSMNYIVGQKALTYYTIHIIRQEEDGSISVWLENEKNEVVLWKSFNVSMPVSIEYNINY